MSTRIEEFLRDQVQGIVDMIRAVESPPAPQPPTDDFKANVLLPQVQAVAQNAIDSSLADDDQVLDNMRAFHDQSTGADRADLAKTITLYESRGGGVGGTL